MSESRLDGNAAAGLLGALFGAEMTLASTICAGCGAREPVGALLVYERAPVTVIRCLHCEDVQLRVVRDGGRTWLDLSGVRCVELGRLTT